MKVFWILIFQNLLTSKSIWANTLVSEKFVADFVEKVEQLTKGEGPCEDLADFLNLCYLGNYKVSVEMNSTASLELNRIRNELKTLKSRPTINEAVLSSSKGLELPKKENLPGFLKSKNSLITEIDGKDRQTLMVNVVDAITRTLNFYRFQLDEVTKADTSFALVILKEVDNRHGATLHKAFPLEQWVQRSCEYAGSSCNFQGDFCKSFTRQWKKRPGSGENIEYWKSESILETYLNATNDITMKNVGDEKEESWPSLIGQCQMALYLRCEVPYVCEKTLLNPTPRSQYLLTHQLLQRMLMENADCPSNPAIQSFAGNEKTYNDLCGKILMETKYLDALDVPPLYRDLFSEMIGLCGYMGYTNFLREDWLNRILSWQSKSESGCFIKSPQFPVDYFSTDVGVIRKVTKQETEQHVQPNEKCLPHFTATSLLALSAYYDYLMDSQVN